MQDPSSKSDSQRPRGNRRRVYGYGYGLLKDLVRIPQLGFGEFFWLLLLLFAANFYMIISLFKFYLNMADYSHALLVPVISAAAAWKTAFNLKAQERPLPGGDWRGLFLLVPGLCIQFFAMWYEIGLVAGGVVSEYFTSVGLVLTVWGCFLCYFGTRHVRLFWFPLFYLLFLIPGLPGPPEAWLKGFLREIVTNSSTGILRLFGYSVFVQNNVIEIPGVLLGVADACSGIRSLWAMLAVAPAIAWFLRLRPFLIALFIPLGVFLAIFQNVVRVVATAVLCDFFGMQWAEGWRHDAVGSVSFFLVSLMMVLLSLRLAPPVQGKEEDRYGAYETYGVYGVYGYGASYGGYGAYHAANDPEAAGENDAEPPDAGAQRELFFTGIARVRVCVYLLLATLGIAQLVVFQRYAIRSRVQFLIANTRQPLDVFPGEVGPYRRIYWGELPEEAMRLLRPSESYVAYYTSPDNRIINLVINFWEPVIGFNGTSWAFPHSPDVCFRGAGWEIEEKVAVPPDLVDEDEILYSRLYTNQQARQMVMYWYNRDQVSILMNEQMNVNVTHGTPSTYANRIHHLFRSWNRPKEYSRFQYSIGVYVQEQGSREETIALAQDFSRHLRQRVGAFGLRPLQKLDLDNLEESLLEQMSPLSEPATP